MSDVHPRPFSRIENFRDFGGSASSFGGRVRTGVLFRSAHLAEATDADLEALGGLGIAAIVDLRRPTERAQHPSRWRSFPGRLIVSDDGDRAVGPHLEFLQQGDLGDEAVEAYLAGYYREAPFERRHLALFGETFAALETGPGALLVHCAAGKDRTGLLAALIGRALGVDMADIMADFLATNRVMMTDERRARIAGWLEPTLGRTPSEAVLRAVMGVTPAHLELAFEAIEARSGGTAPYLAELGVDGLRLERLRTRLLV